MKQLWLIGLVLALGAVACGSPQASPAPSAGNTPQYGGTLNVPIADDPYDYDMSSAGSSNANPYVIKAAYDSLLGRKMGADIGYGTTVIQGGLADKWEVSPDAKVYTFYLRKGIKFANLPPLNGRELTSTDVKWSYEYMSRTGAVKDAKLAAGQ